jgi:Xaa-Pro dipeptidase
MHNEQRQQTIERLQQAGITRALFSHHESVTWLTGFAAPIQLGSHQFAGGPALVWYEDGHFTLIVLDWLRAHAGEFNAEADGNILTYEGYTIQQPIASATNLANVLTELLRKSGLSGAIGIEAQTLPVALLQVLNTVMVGAAITPIDGWLLPLRMIKTAEELVKLRRNFALTDIGHIAARVATQVGQREIDVWTAVHSAIEREVGYRMPLGNDCIVTYREGEGNNIGGWPLDYVIKEDTALIVDLSTRDAGYWSDSCGTYYPQSPTPQQAAMHRMAQEALDYAISLIRPGAVAREVDEKVREFVRKSGYPVYPHHTGHGVGVSPHEEPRIVPYSDTVLQAGMVIMLEPGTYLTNQTGVRLEDAVLVTPDGAEVLTTHDKSL